MPKEEDYISFTSDEITNSAQGNLNTLLMGTLAYFIKNKQPIEDLAKHIGELASKTWKEEMPVEDIAKAISLNMASFGANKIATNVREAEATIKIEEWPEENWFEFSKISRDDFERFFDVWKPIAEKQKLQFTWKKEGDAYVLLLKK